MNGLIVLAIAFALAMDAFAVSVGISLKPEGLNRRQIFKLCLFFGGFQCLMALLGWGAGSRTISLIQKFDHWVAFVLLLVIGLRMIYESLCPRIESKAEKQHPAEGWKIIILSVATSIDAFAVGLSLAALHVDILFPSVIIGIVAALMTLLGIMLGPIFGRILGKRAEFIGGLVLIFIGIKILVDHV
jgi:putative Mn2+ efflux pump MntP